MKASAPKSLVVGFQLLVKIFQPSAVNHEEACWVVEKAIRTRITSTSRPHASARIWKLRSPSGRRCDKGWAGPATSAGPAFVTVLTTTNPSDLRAFRRPSLRRYLAELRLGLRVEARRQR